jgi:hypothetical protein
MSFSRPLFPSDPPQIKLFVAPDREDAGATEGAPNHPLENLTPDVTLSEFYERFFLPVRLTGADPKTLKEDRTTLGKWRAYAGERPLGSIDRVLLAGFLPWLQSQGLGLVTAAKHLARVQTFLRAAGPDRDGDDQGLFAEILEKPPRVKAPALPERDEPDKAFSLREIGSWLDACQQAAPMRRVRSPAAWWQSIVLFDYNFPVRFETLTAARFEWLYWREDVPELKPGWWLKCPPGTDKTDCERRYYVSSHALAALEILWPSLAASLNSATPPAGAIFGLPVSPARIYTHAKKILARSAINPARQQQRVFHGLRAAADTELRKLGYAIAAKRALGRSVGRDVDMGFYTAIAEYVAGMEKLPQPSFSRWREPQLRLF